MFSKALVAFDGSDGALDAIALAELLIRPGAELILCCVHPYQPLSAQIDATEPSIDRESSRQCVKHASELLKGDLQVRTVFTAGSSVSAALNETADMQSADLLVLGTSHHHAVGRMAMGGIVERTLHLSRRPVAVAPAGFCRRNGSAAPQRIAVGYDVATPAPTALRVAVELARQTGAQLRLLAAADTGVAISSGATPGMSFPAIVRARLTAAHKQVDEAIAGLPRDIAASAEVRDGLASEKLLEVSHGVDLLVLGSRGLRTLERLVLGSVSDAVVRRSACPVLIVRESADEDQAVADSEAAATL